MNKSKKTSKPVEPQNLKMTRCTGIFVSDTVGPLNKYCVFILASILRENNEYGFVYSDHFKVDEKGFKKEKVRLNNLDVLYNHGAGVMFRKDVIEKIGFYDESLANCEDYDFLIRMTKNFNGFYVPLPLYRYNIHGDNLSLRDDREEYKNLVRSNHGI